MKAIITAEEILLNSGPSFCLSFKLDKFLLLQSTENVICHFLSVEYLIERNYDNFQRNHTGNK